MTTVDYSKIGQARDEYAQSMISSEEQQLDAEFRARAREIGIPEPVALSEILAAEFADQANPAGRVVPLTTSAGTQRPHTAPPAFQRPEPIRPAHWQADEAKPAVKKRKEIRFNRSEEEIDMVDDQTGETVTIFLRRVPTTELPYLDRLEMRLSHIRTKNARIAGKSRSELAAIDANAAEYNAVMEEMILYTCRMPSGFYRRIDTGALGELQIEIRNMVRAARGDDALAGDDEGN